MRGITTAAAGEGARTVRPVRVLQIGEGNFLRAFADWMIDNANDAGVYGGAVKLVQPIPNGMADAINAQEGLYTVVMRGLEGGRPVTETKLIRSVAGCINPHADYSALLAEAENPDLETIISNTTEAGICYSEGINADDAPPRNYPAMLTAFLYHRYKFFNGAEDKGLLILPVELIDRNGDRLRETMCRYAQEWRLPDGFLRWQRERVLMANTLVDRIVTGFPREEAAEMWERLGYRDDLLTTCERFALWVIEGDPAWAERFPIHRANEAVVWTNDMTPYRTRKVRILNGAHTMTVPAAFLAGHETVLELMRDPLFREYLEHGLFREVLPVLPFDPEETRRYAQDVLERFSNPYLAHRLQDICLNSVSKFTARCLPTLLENIAQTGKIPRILAFGLAALLVLYRGEMRGEDYIGSCAGVEYPVRDDRTVIEKFAASWAEFSRGGDSMALAEALLADSALWGENLAEVEGLAERVAADVERILQNGMEEAVRNALREAKEG